MKHVIVDAVQKSSAIKDKIFDVLWDNANIEPHTVSTFIRYKPEKVVNTRFGYIGVGYEGYAWADEDRIISIVEYFTYEEAYALCSFLWDEDDRALVLRLGKLKRSGDA